MEPGVVSPIVVEKESISEFHFPKTEVLSNADEKKIRSLAMQRAVKLGNNQKRKVKIIFEDDQSIKKVETTVWAITEKNVLLKRGVAIPINRIHQVSAY
ncbi:MAG: hypothetical protein JKY53_06315 [Flavobacteriales bacterium]|nr:hypothetical protein [Flavobacteriales bacterium]